MHNKLFYLSEELSHKFVANHCRRGKVERGSEATQGLSERVAMESKVRSWRKAGFIQPDFLILPYLVRKICPRKKTLAPSSSVEVKYAKLA